MDKQNWDLNLPGLSLFIYKTGLYTIRPYLPYWETGGQNGKARTGKILPGDGESGGPRVRVGLSFVTLGKVPKFLGPQFPLL